MWIQKPRSVRELFQVSVELESPGNIWSLEVPPDDWTTADSRFAAAIEEDRKAADVITSWLQPGETLAVVPDAPPRDRPIRKLETPVSEIFERDHEVSKGNGADEPSAPAFGFAEAAAREQAEPGEIESPLLRELKAQLEREAQRAVEEAASNATQSLKRVSEEAERQNLASAEALFERWKEAIERERDDRAGRDDQERGRANRRRAG